MANEGISDELRKAFLVYLVSHDRTMAEVLAPTRLDIATEFERGFKGMTETPATLDELLNAREDLVARMTGEMPLEHRQFLHPFKAGDPDFHASNSPEISLMISASLAAFRFSGPCAIQRLRFSSSTSTEIKCRMKRGKFSRSRQNSKISWRGAPIVTAARARTPTS